MAGVRGHSASQQKSSALVCLCAARGGIGRGREFLPAVRNCTDGYSFTLRT